MSNLVLASEASEKAASMKPKLTTKVILLLDILGFREMAAGKHAQENLESLYQALSSMESFAADEVKVYSDNALLCWQVFEGYQEPLASESALGSAFLEAAYFQFELTRRGFYARGSIAVGDIFMDDSLVFGPGLIEAYDLESKKAVYPRVILSKQAVKLARTHLASYSDSKFSPHHLLILWASDGTFFLNYLGYLFQGEDGSVIYAELAKHRDGILENLERHRASPIVWEKYRWLANYHDFICNEFREDPSSSFRREVARHSSSLATRSGGRLAGSQSGQPIEAQGKYFADRLTTEESARVLGNYRCSLLMQSASTSAKVVQDRSRNWRSALVALPNARCSCRQRSTTRAINLPTPRPYSRSSRLHGTCQAPSGNSAGTQSFLW